MKRLFKMAMFVFAIAVTAEASATTCTKPGDWLEPVCKFDSLQPNERCWVDPVSAGNMEAQCSNKVTDCSLTPDKQCFGSVDPNHWIVTGTASEGIKRCRCGCFAQETALRTTAGAMTLAASLIGQKDGVVRLATSDNYDTWGQSEHAINGILAGPEKELMYDITTAAGKTISITTAHPVVIVDADAKLSTMKRASDVKQGDYLLSEDNTAEKVVSIGRRAYSGLVVNFNVEADGGDKHIVFANGLRIGDNAWQQYLSAVERRLLTRNDLIILLSKKH